MVASCQQGMSRVLEIQRDARGRDVNVPQNQMDACPNPRPGARGGRDEPGTRLTRLNPLVTAFFVHSWRLLMHSLYQRQRVEDFCL